MTTPGTDLGAELAADIIRAVRNQLGLPATGRRHARRAA